ncbi:MAG: hypothetical protein O7B99_04330, partial [Planctomycetota bacterium]|nr:hypothetical protein [Planctomycetota bacterium]
EMTDGDFYAWIGRNPNLGHYDIAGSWMLFLLKEYGAKKVDRYYKGLSARKAFGKREQALEKAWHAFLDDFPLRPEVEILLRRRRGIAAEFNRFEMDPDERLPAELVGKPADWTPLAEAEMGPEKAEFEPEWARLEGGFRGSHPQDADWSICDLGAAAYGDCVVRATIEPEEHCVGVQFRFGSRCQAMLTNAGTFVYAEGVVASGDFRITGRRSLDFLVERRGDMITIYIDGFRIVQGRASDEPHALGIGVAGGIAKFTNVRIRELP